MELYDLATMEHCCKIICSDCASGIPYSDTPRLDSYHTIKQGTVMPYTCKAWPIRMVMQRMNEMIEKND